ncbi:hypothetical protein [Burkholderia sp. AU6039]|uniref:hypothetical protein n=1 Tax=Burkholderia sp. AU6039 TaxID=2015344 RepID=UPI000B7A6D75|nr:hypothetical protein [Burkholderia sp. AU6039]OXJ20116.1 hypothetical protein CFB39_09190 [Burkholderia sp. AU6039]
MSDAAFDERGILTADHAVASPAHCRAKTASAVSSEQSGSPSNAIRPWPAPFGGQIGVALGLHSMFFVTGVLLAACAGLAHGARGQ